MINTTPIKKYLNDPIKNFLIVPIRYTKKEIDLIENLTISNSMMFDFYGNKTNIDNQKLNTFLANLGPNKDIDLNILYNLIHKLLNKITKASNTDYVWFTIRITLPKHDFDIKRWHKDGPFFTTPPERINQYKFVSVLKGPGTLFYKNSKQINEIYENNIQKRRSEYKKTGIKQTYMDEIDIKYRKKLANSLKNIKYKQLKNNEGLIFITGSNMNDLDDGTLHSEPKLDKPRFFISILPGSEREINELIKRWNVMESTRIFAKTIE